MQELVLIRGGGDIASGIAHRLHRSGFKVVMTELAQPTVVRRSVAFAQAVFEGQMAVEGVTARKVDVDQVAETLSANCIPLIVDDKARCCKELRPGILVDAILAKRNMGTGLLDAPVVIGIGPGFTAKHDVHAVVETMRGHDLGRVYYEGAALEDTGIPGEIGGYTIERLIKSPACGVFSSCSVIGAAVTAGDVIGYVNGSEVKVSISGVLRGIIQEGTSVQTGMKLGDVDPRCRKEHCFTISDKARAVAGGVLEAVLHFNKMGYC
jgi:xanthine dehydrogenase accessory factor